MSKSYSDRVMRFRAAVYPRRPGLTDGCRLLLLRLSDGMDAKAIVSIPRRILADELGVAPARITEWVRQGKDLGFLSTVRRARPGVTAVYQGLIPPPVQGTRRRTSEVRDGVPTPEVRETGPFLVRDGVPLSAPQRYATAVPQVVAGAQRQGTPVPDAHNECGKEETA